MESCDAKRADVGLEFSSLKGVDLRPLAKTNTALLSLYDQFFPLYVCIVFQYTRTSSWFMDTHMLKKKEYAYFFYWRTKKNSEEVEQYRTCDLYWIFLQICSIFVKYVPYQDESKHEVYYNLILLSINR